LPWFAKVVTCIGSEGIGVVVEGGEKDVHVENGLWKGDPYPRIDLRQNGKPPQIRSNRKRDAPNPYCKAGGMVSYCQKSGPERRSIGRQGMSFPARYYCSIVDVAGRWGCTQTEVVNWAISGELDLVAGFSPILSGDDPAAGLLIVSAFDMRPLFPLSGKAAKKVFVKQARRVGSEAFKLITKPARGLRLTAADIRITAREIDGFKQAHGIGRIRNAGPGARGRYDGTSNQEPNALLYHQPGLNADGTDDGYMRAHSDENRAQHQTFLMPSP